MWETLARVSIAAVGRADPVDRLLEGFNGDTMFAPEVRISGDPVTAV